MAPLPPHAEPGSGYAAASDCGAWAVRRCAAGGLWGIGIACAVRCLLASSLAECEIAQDADVEGCCEMTHFK